MCSALMELAVKAAAEAGQQGQASELGGRRRLVRLASGPDGYDARESE